MESIVHKPLAPALASRHIRFAQVPFYGSLTQLDTLAMQVSSRPGRSGSKAGTGWSRRERFRERCSERRREFVGNGNLWRQVRHLRQTLLLLSEPNVAFSTQTLRCASRRRGGRRRGRLLG